MLVAFGACDQILEPQPVDLLSDELVLNDARDVPSVEIGLYSAFRSIAAPKIIAGDFTADMLIHNGTFTQYRELGNKQITSANASVAALWGSIYRTIYISNYILERLPDISGLPASERSSVIATARFLRGYAYFVAAHTYGGVPLATTTTLAENRNIPRASKEEVLAFVLEDYLFALEAVPVEAVNAAFVNVNAIKAALARYHLYEGNWQLAEQFSSEVIASGSYTLVENFSEIVLQDFTSEAILEVGYSFSDDPGTSTNFGLNNLFLGRREIIPSNEVVFLLYSNESGDRRSSIAFSSSDLGGRDNGWSVRKYGTADEDNNNIIVFRLAEMYLIRAEARVRQNKLNGPGSGEEDINVLRTRANAPLVEGSSQGQMLSVIERERVYELAFEGHRWYDLVRTGRANEVMLSFNSNWSERYLLWPIPLNEIQNNPALVGNQNPGY
ncbi:MAG: RagB/SusD family nutrient uptake outer membrane protein [Bacteroidota bacterium]|nr:RagB/SusD family nutrient uptake outer membrane protein [Bacteroidota bacterium]